jgi:hypothetical protein
MKIIKKSIFAVVKSLFNKVVELAENAFTGNLMTRVWEMYREERDKLFSKDEDLDWGIKRKSYLLSYCIKFVKQVIKFEEEGVVYFKKVGDDATVHVRRIVTGVLTFNPIGCGLYRFVDADVLEENGGEIKGAIRSFRIENICIV